MEIYKRFMDAKWYEKILIIIGMPCSLLLFAGLILLLWAPVLILTGIGIIVFSIEAFMKFLFSSKKERSYVQSHI